MMKGEWLSKKETAAYVGCHPESLRRFIVMYGFPAPKRFTERIIRWKASEVRAWIESRIRNGYSNI